MPIGPILGSALMSAARGRSGKSKGSSVLRAIVLLVILIIVLVVATGAMSLKAAFNGPHVSSKQAVQVAQKAKFTDVKVVSRTSFMVSHFGIGCESGDTVRYKLTGRNAKGEPSTFYVCYGPRNAARVVPRK